MPESYTGEQAPTLQPVQMVDMPTQEQQTPTRWEFEPDDLATMVLEPEFAEKSTEEKHQLIDTVSGKIHEAWQSEGMTADDYKAYAELTDLARKKADPSWTQWAGEETVALAKSLPGMAADIGAGAAGAVANLGGKMTKPFTAATEAMGIKTPKVLKSFQELGDTAGESFTRNAQGLVTGPAATIKNQLSPTFRELSQYADKLTNDLYTGAAGNHSKESLTAFLQETDKKLAPLMTRHAGANVASENGLLSEGTQQLIGSYIKTRDPKLLGAIRSRILENSSTFKQQQKKKELLASEGAAAFDSVFGKGSAEHIITGMDPLNLVMGYGAAAKTVSKTVLLRYLSEEAAERVLKSKALSTAIFASEQAAMGGLVALRENPNASAGEIAKTIAQFQALGGVMHGASAAVKYGAGKLTGKADAPRNEIPTESPVNNEIPSQITNPAEMRPVVTDSTQAAPSIPDQLALRRADPEGYQQMQQAYEENPAAVPPSFVAALGLDQPKELPTTAEPAPSPASTAPAPQAEQAPSSAVASVNQASPQAIMPIDSTAMKNESVNARREALGLPPVTEQPVRSRETVEAEAADLMRDPQYAPARLSQLESDPTLAYTDTDTIVMQAYEQQLDPLAKAGNAAAIAEITRIGDLNKKGGSAASYAMLARKGELRNEVPPLSELLSDAKAAAVDQGKELTPERIQEVTELHAKMEAQAEQIKQQETKIAELEAAAKNAAEQGTAPPPVLSVAMEVRAAKIPPAKAKNLSLAANAALNRILNRKRAQAQAKAKAEPRQKQASELFTPEEKADHKYERDKAKAVKQAVDDAAEQWDRNNRDVASKSANPDLPPEAAELEAVDTIQPDDRAAYTDEQAQLKADYLDSVAKEAATIFDAENGKIPPPEYRRSGDPFMDATGLVLAADVVFTMARQARDLYNFSRPLIAHFGQWVKPHAKKLWEAAQRGLDAVHSYLKDLAAVAKSKKGAVDIGSAGEKLPADVLEDLSLVVSEYLRNGQTPEQARASLRKDLGAEFDTHFHQIHAKAEAFNAKLAAQAAYDSSPAAVVDAAKATIDPNAPIDRKVAREVAKAHVTEAMEEGRMLGEDELTHLVQTSLEPIYGQSMDTSTVREAWANYGNPKPPTVDAVKAHFAELRSRALIQSQIDRINAKLPVLKTGQQTKAKSVEVRTLIEERARLMKEAGIQPKDPAKELASRRTRVISALRNEREKLQAIIDGKLERVTPDKAPFKDDAEIAGLRAEVEDLRKREAEMRAEDPATDADTRARIAAERGAESYNRKLKLGTLPEKKQPVAYSDATKQAIAAQAKARQAYQELVNRHPDTIAKKSRERAAELQAEESALDLRIQAAEAQLAGRATAMPSKPEQAGPPMFADKLKRLKDLKEAARNLKDYYAQMAKNPANIKNEARLAAENRLIDYHVKRAALSDFTAKHSTPFEYNDAVQQAIEARKQAQAAYEALRDADPATKAEREAYALQELDQRISKARQDLQTALAGTDPTKPHQTRPPAAAAIKSRLDELTAIRKLTQQTVNELPAVRRAKKLKLINSAIAREEAWLAGKRRNPSPLFPVLMDSELQARQEHLNTLREQRASTAEEIANKEQRINDNRAKQLKKQAEELRQTIKEIHEGKMPEKKAKVQRVYEQRVLDEQVKVYDLKAEMEEARLKLEIANYSGPRYALYLAEQASRLNRDIMSSLDVSHAGRQGLWFNINHPIMGWKNFKKTLEAFKDKRGYVAAEKYIQSQENFKNGSYKDADLFFADLSSSDATKREDFASSSFAQKIPGIAGSSRAYTTAANLQRADVYNSKAAQIERGSAVSGPAGPMTMADKKALGNYINKATGRGRLLFNDQTMASAAHLLFSPRLAAARINMVFMEPLIKARMMGSKRVARIILMDYARFMAAVLAVGAGGAAAATAAWGALPRGESRFEWSPLSSNFLKPRVGKDGQTRLDITGGHGSYVTFVLRTLLYRTKNKEGKVEKMNAGQWQDNIVSFARTKASPTVGALYSFGQGKDPVGGAATLGSTVTGALIPLPIQQGYQAFKDSPPLEGAFFTGASALGLGTSDYDAFKKNTKRETERGREDSLYFDLINKIIEDTRFEDVSIQRYTPSKTK